MKRGDLSFLLSYCSTWSVFLHGEGGRGSPALDVALPPGRSANGFLIYVSGQLARNVWDHGKASVFFASRVTVGSDTGRAVQFGGSRDKTCVIISR